MVFVERAEEAVTVTSVSFGRGWNLDSSSAYRHYCSTSRFPNLAEEG